MRKHGRGPQTNGANSRREFAAGSLDHHAAERRRIKHVCRKSGLQKGKETEIVDDASLADLLPSTVIGHQIAAESGEMRRVLAVDVNLLANLCGKQDRQPQSGEKTERCGTFHTRIYSRPSMVIIPEHGSIPHPAPILHRKPAAQK